MCVSAQVDPEYEQHEREFKAISREVLGENEEESEDEPRAEGGCRLGVECGAVQYRREAHSTSRSHALGARQQLPIQTHTGSTLACGWDKARGGQVLIVVEELQVTRLLLQRVCPCVCR